MREAVRRAESERQCAGRRSLDPIGARSRAERQPARRRPGRGARLDEHVVHVPSFVRSRLQAARVERSVGDVAGEAESDPRRPGVAGKVGRHAPPGPRRAGKHVGAAKRGIRVELDLVPVAAVHREREPFAARDRDLDPAAVERLGPAIGFGVDVGIEDQLRVRREIKRGREERRVFPVGVGLRLVRPASERKR